MLTDIRGIVPAVNDFSQIRAFLKSEYPLCAVMNMHITSLESVFRQIQEGGRKALVHCDLINGLAQDEYGAEYICGRFRPAGVISIRPTVITACKRLGVTSVQRAFLIDSSALKKSVANIKKAAPDYVELLPALCTPLFPELEEELRVPLIAGGLIGTREQAEEILRHTCVRAVTISMDKLA